MDTPEYQSFEEGQPGIDLTTKAGKEAFREIEDDVNRPPEEVIEVPVEKDLTEYRLEAIRLAQATAPAGATVADIVRAAEGILGWLGTGTPPSEPLPAPEDPEAP